MISITCPTCGETFEIPAPHESEVPCSVDYDCEICCRPMLVVFREEAGEVTGEAHGLGE